MFPAPTVVPHEAHSGSSRADKPLRSAQGLHRPCTLQPPALLVPLPGVTSSAKGTCWCPVPALGSSPAPDPQIPVLPWAPLPSCTRSSFLTLSPNTPYAATQSPGEPTPRINPPATVLVTGKLLAALLEQEVQQSSPWTSVPTSHSSAQEAPGAGGFLPSAGGSTIHRTPPPPHPESEAMETPRPHYLGPGAAGGQGGSIRTVAAPEGAASSIPGVTEPD